MEVILCSCKDKGLSLVVATFQFETLTYRCLSNGETPPSKERLEYPPPSDANTGLTSGIK